MREDAAAEDKAIAKRSGWRGLQSAKLWELRAAISIARLSAIRESGMRPATLLAPVDEWFTQGFYTLDFKVGQGRLEGLRADNEFRNGLKKEICQKPYSQIRKPGAAFAETSFLPILLVRVERRPARPCRSIECCQERIHRP